MDHAEVAAVVRAQLVLFQQELRQPGDRRERIVELVRDARHQLADGSQLLALDELGFHRLLVRHVLHEHDEALLGGGVGHAGGGEPHRATQPRGARDQGRRPLTEARRLEQILERGRLPQRVREVLADHVDDGTAQHRRE